MSLTLSAGALRAERGGRLVFAGVGFVLRGGEALGVTGPNGAGKSTLLRVLAGLLAPAEGAVRLDPPDEADAETPVCERAHYLGHADALKAALTPLENLAFSAALTGRRALTGGKAAAGRAALDPEAALARVALSHAADLPCGYLSAGQRRRVALARLLVAQRPLWLLDEPGTALDSASQAVLTAMMAEHLAAGGLIVAATHAPLGLPGLRDLRLGAERLSAERPGAETAGA